MTLSAAVPKKKHSKLKPLAFAIDADPGSDVRVCGSFNDWNTDSHKMTYWDADGQYHIILTLPPGEHEYRFLINGEWHTDSRCYRRSNQLGTVNNVLRIK